MPISNVNFVGEKDPIKKIQTVYKAIDDASIDAIFKEDEKKKEVTRDYVEMIIEDFALLTQNQALYNKFLSIDTKLEKSLREYQAEIKGLLNTIVGLTGPIPQTQNPVTLPQQPQPQPINQQVQTPEPVQTPPSIGIE